MPPDEQDQEVMPQPEADEPLDEWKIVEMARIVVEKNGGSPNYATFIMTPDQYKIFLNTFEIWLSRPLDKQAFNLENLMALVKRKGAEVASQKAHVDKVHAEADAFYDNCPKFDSEAEFMKNILKKGKPVDKTEDSKKRGKSFLLGAFGSKGVPPPE